MFCIQHTAFLNVVSQASRICVYLCTCSYTNLWGLLLDAAPTLSSPERQLHDKLASCSTFPMFWVVVFFKTDLAMVTK